MPRRWSDLDSDEYRLPEGFRRVGYDADEGRYYFSGGGGQMWRSAPGSEYGVLTPVDPEPPVTIPRRPFPYYSEEPIDDPPRKSTSRYKTFQEMLNPHQITSAPSTSRRRSYTINIPSVAWLKRSSANAASFIRSRGKYFTKSEHLKEQSREKDIQESPNIIHHDRAVSSPVTATRSFTTPASMRGEMKSSAEPVETLHRRGWKTLPFHMRRGTK